MESLSCWLDSSGVEVIVYIWKRETRYDVI